MVKKYVTHRVFIRCFWSVITFEHGSNPMNCLVEALTLLLLLRLIGASIPPVVYPCVNTISAAALDELHHFFWWRFQQWPCAIGSAADVVSSSQSIVFGRSFAASERSLATRCDICIHGQDSWLQPFAPVCWFNPELPHPHNLWKMSSAQTCCNVWFPSQKGSTIYTDGNKAINQNNSVQTREWCPWACRQHRDTWGSFSWSSGEKSWMPATVPFLAQRKRREGKPSRNLWAEKPIMIIYERAFVPFGFRRDDKLCYWSPLRSREAAKIASDSVQPAGWVGEYGREVLPLYKGYCCWSQQMGGPGAPSLWRRVRCWGFEDSPYQLESVFMSFTL